MAQESLFAIVDGKVTRDVKCTLCPLGVRKGLVTNCMKGVGAENPLFMFVGVSPGQEDDERATPYSGPTGRVLNDLRFDAGIKSGECFDTNTIRCAGAPDKASQYWKKCKVHFVEELQRVKPQAIVAIGGAASMLTGLRVDKLSKRTYKCVFDPTIPVYLLPQPAVLFHVEGQARANLRHQLVEHLAWIKDHLVNKREAPKLATDYRVAKTLDDVDAILSEFDNVDEVCFDLETNQLQRPFRKDGAKIIALGLSKGPGHARIIPLEAKAVATPMYWADGLLSQIEPRVANLFARKKFFGFNAILYDSLWVEEFFGTKPKISYDAQVNAYLIDENPPLTLESLALRYTDMDGWKGGFNLEDPKRLCEYLWQDVDATSRLRTQLEHRLTPKQRALNNNLLIPLSWALRDMEWRGVVVDEARLEELDRRIQERQEPLRKRLCSYPQITAWEIEHNKFFNPASPDQVADVLKNHFKLKQTKETKTGKYAVDKEVLENNRHIPFCADLMSMRALGKLRDTYVAGLREVRSKQGTVHTSFHIHTVTGRAGSSDPNLQNIPRDDEDEKAEFPIKTVFVARPGYILLSADYSQVELRVLASLSGDKNLRQIFLDGLDAHTGTAAIISKCSPAEVTKAARSQAKRVNFAIPYGAGIDTIIKRSLDGARSQARKEKKPFTKQMAREVEERTREFFAAHQRTFPDVWKWMRAQGDFISKGGIQQTPTGRKRNLGKADARARRQSQNFPVQGLASDITEFSIVRTKAAMERLGLDAYQVLTVHDSNITEVREDLLWEVADLQMGIMENPGFPWLTVPMKVDMEAGYSYGEMLKLDLAKREFVA